MTEQELNDFKDEELISIKLPRKQYKRLVMMLEREEAYDKLTNMLKSSWIWVVGGGILTLFLLWDRLHIGVIK